MMSRRGSCNFLLPLSNDGVKCEQHLVVVFVIIVFVVIVLISFIVVNIVTVPMVVMVEIIMLHPDVCHEI